MASKKVRVRINPGLRLDAATVNEDLTITKSWTEVSTTVAKSLVDSTYQGRNLYEFEDEVVDETPSETVPETTEDAAE